MTQLTQPKGAVSKETNKEAIARVYGLKKKEVGYLNTSTAIDSYTVLYEPETQTCWYRGTATGTAVSWTVTNKLLNLTTSNGSYVLAVGYSGDILRQDLGSDEEGLGGDLVSANSFFSVRQVLSRIRTLADTGAPLPYLGYDPTNDAALYNAMGQASDRHLLLNGGLHLAGECANGIRRNINLLSVRGGQGDAGQGFNTPLLGVSNSRELRAYDIYESVPGYFDMTSPERQTYHTVATATYTETTATIDPDTYAETLEKLKVGHYIRTMHSTYCIGLVTAIDADTGVITVDEWADSGTTTTTPEDGVGLYTRFITKIYVMNLNMFITANSDITNASGVEMGMSSKKDVSGSVIGFDIPVLKTSTNNMTAAIVIRHSTTNGSGLTYGIRVSDAQVNFHSASTSTYGRTTRAGFNESGNAIVGFRRNGTNTYSDLWSTTTDLTDVSIANSPMIIGPNGNDYRHYDHLQIISADATLSGLYPSLIVAASGVTITMPPASSHKAGHSYTMELALAGEYAIAANGGDTTVNGYTSYSFTTTVANKNIKVTFDGSYWRVSGHN